MATNSGSRFPIEAFLFIIATAAGILFILMKAGPELLAELSRPTPTKAAPTLTPVISRYQPESIPASTDTPNPTLTATVPPTNTAAPTITPTPTYFFNDKPLPDLTVTGISDPVCSTIREADTITHYVKIKLVIRNIGRASTHYFGTFDNEVYVLLGESSYRLDEWADQFNGLISDPHLKVLNVDPNWDITFTLAINLKGNTNFGIKAVANAGKNTIAEADTTNNRLIKYFSVYCY